MSATVIDEGETPRRSVDAAPLPSLPPTTRILRPQTGWRGLGIQELWRNRAVVGFLVRRDLKVRYAQTALGALWALFQPLAPMLVFTVVFGVLAKVPSDGAPYLLFSLTGLVAWTYFATAVLGATTSLITNSELVTKVYVPRLAIPLAPLLGALVDLAIGLALLGALLVIRRVTPLPSAIVLAPLLLVLLVATAAGAGYWLAALTARFRDVKHVTPVLLQVLMYASPVVYPTSLIPPQYRPLYALNPMVGVIEGLRAVLLRTTVADGRIIGVSCAVSATLLLSGVLYFRRTERLFADIV
jgi:homopolymeric O-antigen transport system permease protein